MKRIIGCLLLIMIMASSCALAEVEFDASPYTLEELFQIRTAIDAEINSRVSAATATLIPSTYVVGVDIKAGAYILVGLMDEAPNGYTPQVLYAKSLDDASSWDYVDYQYLKEGVKWRITLQDGMALEIRYGECQIQQAPPLLFAP